MRVNDSAAIRSRLVRVLKDSASYGPATGRVGRRRQENLYFPRGFLKDAGGLRTRRGAVSRRARTEPLNSGGALQPLVRKLCFVATEDWFFASHFLPFAKAAMAEGFAVSLICNVGPKRSLIEAAGIRVLALPQRRRSLNPFGLLATIAGMVRLLRQERPDIVHLIALKPIVLGGMAARLAGIRRRVLALTGIGYLGLADGLTPRLLRLGLRRAVRPLLDGPQTRWLFENRSDPALFGLPVRAEGRIAVIGGAGIDSGAIVPAPLPEGATLKVALVARMLWSKGIDLAVEAVRRARAQGADVTLSLYGAPDPGNPRAFGEAQLRAWSQLDGIAWHGPTTDVGAVWAAHHVCCLPSRGGEGLPRSLLEAAAYGRAILTTDVPGCRDLVRDGIEGRVVPGGDAAALAKALSEMAQDRQAVRRMGLAARERLQDGFTEEAVNVAVVGLYRALLPQQAEPPALKAL